MDEGKAVVVAALDTDFRRQPFQQYVGSFVVGILVVAGCACALYPSVTLSSFHLLRAHPQHSRHTSHRVMETAALAHRVDVLTAKCRRCGAPAQYTARNSPSQVCVFLFNK